MMNTKDIVVVALLLAILAVIIKLMQASKMQTELSMDMASKMGVPLRSKMRVPAEDVEYEDEEYEDEEEDDEDEADDTEQEVEVHEESNGVVISMHKGKLLKPGKGKKDKAERVLELMRDDELSVGELRERYFEAYGKIEKNNLWAAIYKAEKKGMIEKKVISDNPKRIVFKKA